MWWIISVKFSSEYKDWLSYIAAILSKLLPIYVDPGKKSKKKTVLGTISGYCNSKVPAAEELAETPAEGTAWDVMGEVHHSCFPPKPQPAAATAPQNGPEALSPMPQENCGLAEMGCWKLWGTWEEPQVVTTQGVSPALVRCGLPQRTKLSELWICKSAQRSSPRLRACEKGSTLWSRGYKHNIEYQMAFLMLMQEPTGTSKRLQADSWWNFVRSCRHTSQHSLPCFSPEPSAVIWQSLPLFQGFTWNLFKKTRTNCISDVNITCSECILYCWGDIYVCFICNSFFFKFIFSFRVFSFKKKKS